MSSESVRPTSATFGRRTFLAGAAMTAVSAACSGDDDDARSTTPGTPSTSSATSSSTSPSTAAPSTSILPTTAPTTTTPTTTADAQALPHGLDASAVPGTDTIYGWIQTVFDQGIRRPGYPADDWAIEFCAQQFRDLGLEDVRLEPIRVTRWEPHEWSLDVTTSDGETRRLDCFPMPFSAPVDELDVELAPFVPADPRAVGGKASLLDSALLRIPPDALVPGGSAPDDLTGRVVDPQNTFAGTEHVVPFSGSFQDVLAPSADAGAVAVVGALIDYPGDSYQYYVPYDAQEATIPGVWIRGSDGTWLHERLAGGPVRIRMTIRSSRRDVESANVVGELPGADDELVIVGSHHDGPWASAVEDGSGISLVLAQASFWASQPVERRPHRLMFLLQGGHMSGGAGIPAFLAAHSTDLERTVLELHLEHASLDFVERKGKLVPTGHCVPRWWFTSRIPPLEAAVIDALESERLHRSMVLAPDAFGDAPPTDGSGFFRVGVPAVNFLAAPFYLFDKMDTMDKIDREHLVPLTRAAIRIIGSTTGVSASAMRAAKV